MSLTMNSRERVLAALRGEQTDCMPVICVNQHATYEQMEQLGAGWPAAHNKAEAMAALAAGAHSLLSLDAVRVPYCQTFEAEALGAGVKDGGEKNLPSIDHHPYKVGEVPEFPEDFLNRGRIPELIKAVRILKESLGDKVIIMGGVVGPFSIATSLLGINGMLMNSFKKPDLVRPFMEYSEKAGSMLANALVDAGADLIVVEDMMASMDMISPKIFRDLALPFQKIQVENIKAPVILHICGRLDELMVDIARTGAAAISVEHTVNVPSALASFRAENFSVPIIGAVDPVKTLFQGTADAVKNEVYKAHQEGISIVSPGCAVPPATPTSNLRAMVEAAREINTGNAGIVKSAV